MKNPDEIKRGLVEAIEEVSWVTEGGDAHDLIDTCEKAHASMADALAYIRQLESQAPKWISVEEMLPDGEENRYLIRMDHGFIDTAIWDGEWELWADAGEVTHWMPLPKPPKEGLQ